MPIICESKYKSDGKKKKRVVILFPVQEEDCKKTFVDKEAYKRIFKKAYSNLKIMVIGENKNRKFIAKNKLFSLIE